jgi:hypothetical protein
MHLHRLARFALPALLCLSPALAGAAVFQWRVPVATERGDRDVFLWVPPDAPFVRGVVVAGFTLMEAPFAGDPAIRAACARERLAIVFFKAGLAQLPVQPALERLAAESGYGELSRAPLFFVGHSAGGPQARAKAVEFADRCFGLVQFRGGLPGGHPELPPEIPTLAMLGQFDEFGGTMRSEEGREGAWEGPRDVLAAWRRGDPRRLASIVVEPGAGHFAWSDRCAAYLALFLAKAARAQIPTAGEIRPAWPNLRRIDPNSGWLAELPALAPPAHAAAPAASFTGDPGRASWLFDEEMACAGRENHAALFGRLDQFIEWDDACRIESGVRFFFLQPEWLDDGATFRVHPRHGDTYPAQHEGEGPRWAQAGQPAGHANAPISVRAIGGPLEAAGPGALRIAFDTLVPAGEASRLTFLASCAGDDRHRYTERVGMIEKSFRGWKGGAPQTITFAELPDRTRHAGPAALCATSDSGLPVRFYVACGPAVVEGATLRIAEVPVRARYPIDVRVVAWQFGRGREPVVNTADPVERVFRIVGGNAVD